MILHLSDSFLTFRNKIKIDPQMTHYPDNPHTAYTQWRWCKDEFVPQLKSGELELYVKQPSKFREDFLNSLKLYIMYCEELERSVFQSSAFFENERIVYLLTLLFLFQSAMDYHYYRFDYLLDLEEYSKSPLGWHYLRIKEIVAQVLLKISTSDKRTWVNEKLLTLLSKNGKNTVAELKSYLRQEQIKQLEESYEAIQVFLQVQQEEEKLFYGENQKGPIFTTGYLIWNTLSKAIKKSYLKLRHREKLIEILKGDPIYGTRYILVHLNLFFSEDIVKMVGTQIKRWSRTKV